jgi:cell division transport system permease protein
MNGSRGISALPRRELGSRMLPLVIAVMVFLAALSVAGFGAISNGLNAWRADLASRMTVQIPARPAGDLEQRVAAALKVLREWPAVARARELTDAELSALLEPWLGKDASLSALPVPRLIDVVAKAGVPLEVDGLAAALADASPGALLDNNQKWVGQVARIASTVRTVTLGVILLIALAGVAIVVFATRAGLSVHHENVEILHLMGAQDVFIAREFQMRYFRLGLLGGVLGVLLTGVTLFAAFHVLERAQGPWLPRLLPGPETWAVVVILPIVAGFLAMATARTTVLRALARMV